MKPSLQKLQKFLKLESERGYDNRAVVGGLERALSHWEAEARSEGVPETIVQQVRTQLRNYSAQNPSERYVIVQNIWQQMQRSMDQPLPPLPPFSATAPETAANKPERRNRPTNNVPKPEKPPKTKSEGEPLRRPGTHHP